MGSFPESRRQRAVRELNATAAQIEKAFIEAGISGLPVGAYDKFRAYLELLLRWNQRLSLTAVREPDQIIQRHFVECAFVAQRLPRDVADLLDYGSGAGLPGIPIAICRPEIQRDLSRGARQESILPPGGITGSRRWKAKSMTVAWKRCPSVRFDAVAMRAVEKMDLAIPLALQRVKRYLVLLTTERSGLARGRATSGLEWLEPISIPNTRQMVLEIGRRGVGCSTWNNTCLSLPFRVFIAHLFHVEHQDFHRDFRKRPKTATQPTSLLSHCKCESSRVSLVAPFGVLHNLSPVLHTVISCSPRHP